VDILAQMSAMELNVSPGEVDAISLNRCDAADCLPSLSFKRGVSGRTATMIGDKRPRECSLTDEAGA